MKYLINEISSIILTFIVYYLGGFDIALKSLLIIIIIDYITGVLSAIYNKKLSSKIGFRGIIKKFSYIFIVALSVVLDKILGNTGTVRNLVIYFFVANDGISILENVSEMNIPLPKKLIEILEQLKDKEGE